MQIQFICVFYSSIGRFLWKTPFWDQCEYVYISAWIPYIKEPQAKDHGDADTVVAPMCMLRAENGRAFSNNTMLTNSISVSTILWWTIFACIPALALYRSSWQQLLGVSRLQSYVSHPIKAFQHTDQWHARKGVNSLHDPCSMYFVEYFLNI